MNKPLPAAELAARLGRWSAGRGPLYVLLAARLRAMIDDGELRPGTALPADRTLAAALAVGRSTVVAAYDLLSQDGKIVRRQGSGTRVAPAALRPDPGRPVDTTNPLFAHLLEAPDHVIQLTCAAVSTAPEAVRDAYEKALVRPITGDIGYYPAGHPALREALADRYTARGLPTDPGQILVTSGGQQALSLLAGVLVGPGDRVLVEAPTYPGALEVFRQSAATLRGVPTGADGLDLDATLRALRDRPSAAYLVLTHHNPTGSVLPNLARRRLAETAAELGVPLIDDEVLADLAFDGPPPPPLAAFAPEGTGITIGSLSKSVWGGLRVGWVRASAALVMRLARLKAIHDLGSNVVGQLAAAELVADLDGLLAERVTELRVRHDRLCAELSAALPDWEFRPVPGGQTLWVRLPHGDGVSFAQRALRSGVAVLPGGSLDVSGASGAHLRLPFLEPPDRLAEAVRRMAEAWRDYTPAPHASPSLTSLVV
ncbi:DNA-binding transcriptional MocR family regulator [Prauserella shujinwangii]|uniref:DNA-binding transcriptional MocR family regulator n=1 Tax=Prauserella shujinwangii TaxID=1453103 RepID=A0A2T0LQ93_9PSEU|nr:PLP-dependent aminotransferase family protein [Prauserella shujinwangii]PRX45432.1 DNA-binding transcriptional MocR family regulator [Prauserella shujinwangii]